MTLPCSPWQGSCRCALRRSMAASQSQIAEGAKSSASDRLPVFLDEVAGIGEHHWFRAAADAGPQRLHRSRVRVLHSDSHERLAGPFLCPELKSRPGFVDSFRWRGADHAQGSSESLALTLTIALSTNRQRTPGGSTTMCRRRQQTTSCSSSSLRKSRRRIGIVDMRRPADPRLAVEHWPERG
jgi:hypothetical protein